jgi:hypothetical protein
MEPLPVVSFLLEMRSHFLERRLRYTIWQCLQPTNTAVASAPKSSVAAMIIGTTVFDVPRCCSSSAAAHSTSLQKQAAVAIKHRE